MLNEYSQFLIQQFGQLEQLQRADPKLQKILLQLDNKKYEKQFFIFNKLLFTKTPHDPTSHEQSNKPRDT